MDAQLRRVFGLALLFALVFGTISAERAVAQTTPLPAESCPTGDTIMVDTDTFLTVEAADAAARADSASERERTMEELFDCAMQEPGSTLQFADGTYDDVGRITIGNSTNNDGDDSITRTTTEKVTFQGNSSDREAVKFTGEVNFRVQASNISMEYITFEDTENIEMLNWPHVVDALEVGQTNLAADKCRENVEIRNCVFRNTRKDGVSYFTGDSVKADCTPRGFTVADSLFENIGYNNEWEDGYGPGDVGTGIPKIIPATVEGATTHKSGTTPHHVNQSRNVGIRVHGSGLIKNVAIIGNTIDGTTHSGMLVHGVTGAAGDKIEISYNNVSNVPRSGIVVLESPTTTAAGYNLEIKKNLVVNSGTSPWLVADYDWYAQGDSCDDSYSSVKSILGDGTDATDKVVDSVLKPEIWSITENIVEDGTVIFGSDEAPVNIYDNFGGADNPTDDRVSEYAGNGNRVSRSSSKIPASNFLYGRSFSGTNSCIEDDPNTPDVREREGGRAGSCIEDDSNTIGVEEDEFACFSVIRFLDPYAAGAIQLNGVSTDGDFEIMENELRNNTLGLVLCGGSGCYFNSPYSAITTGYTNNNAAFIKPDISINNIYGESAMSVTDRAELPTEFAMGAVYVSIGQLSSAERVSLDGNYLGQDPKLFTDTVQQSLSEVSEYTLETTRLDIEIPLNLITATVTGDTLTLTYSETLDEESVPAASDFTVMVDGEERNISMVSVSGAAVTLTLASAVAAGDAVTVSYTPGINPIRDASGEKADAVALTDRAVTNNIPPTITTVAVNGDTLTLIYNENLDSTSVPAAPDFTVRVGGSAGPAVTNVAVSGAAVTLTLASAVEDGDTVTVSYTPGSNPIQNASGVNAEPLADRKVINYPGQVSSITTIAGDAQVALVWNPPASGGSPITRYEIQWKSGSESFDSSRQQTSTTPSATISSLTNGTAYDFRVRAVNAVRNGTWSVTASETPVTMPGQVTGLTATAGDAQVALSWTAPADGGSAITMYEVQWKSGSQSFGLNRLQTLGVTTARISSLTNGTAYEFRVQAFNEVGSGAWSTPVSVTPATVPGAPTSLEATAGDAEVDLSWAAPVNNGGRVITSYTVQWKTGLQTFGDPSRERPSQTSPATITGLTNGTAYEFRVQAFNEVGSGAWSTPVSVTPATVPGAPTSLEATAGDAEVDLSWAAPVNNGGRVITSYTVQWKTGLQTFGDPSRQRTSQTNSATIASLTNGRAYDFRVRAVNEAGNGAWSTISSVTPAVAPGQVTGLSATAGNGQVSLSWAAPADGGSAITRYEVQWKGGSQSFGSTRQRTSTTTSAIISSLTNGMAYDFRVRAVNAVGNGTWSVTASETPVTTPKQVTGLTATAGDAQVALSWTAPANGGSVITGYLIQWKSGSESFDISRQQISTSTSKTITGLSNGMAYDFRVRAVNAVGNGTWSVTASETPVTTPGQVTGLTATAGDAQVALSWTTPADGGSTITVYEVQWKSDAQNFEDSRQQTSTTPSTTISSLTNGTAYDFRVRAVNAVGNGTWSVTASETPVTMPGQVTGLTATAGDAQVALSWTAPANGGSVITGYLIQWKSGSESFDISRQQNFPPSTTPSATISLLTNGTAYDFRVRAVNAVGNGTWSVTASETPVTTPRQVTELTATVGDAQVALSWTVPADGGSTITVYEVQWKSGSESFDISRQQTSTTTSATISSLTNGTAYDFRVRAVNAVGNGTWSVTASKTPVTTPGQVTGLTATAGDAQVALSWTTPADGGSTITVYEVQWKRDAQNFEDSRQQTSTTLSATISSLTNGTAYDFRVRATNSVGDGEWSATTTATPTSPPPPVRPPTGPTGPTQQPLEIRTVAVNGNTLTLTYSKTLDSASVPATGDFTVRVGGEAGPAVTAVSVSGTAVRLMLASAVESGDAVTISYTPGDNPIRDTSGVDAGALTADRTIVRNNTSGPMLPLGGGGGSSEGGCALVSGGSGVSLGMLFALMAMPFGFATASRKSFA